MPKHDLPTSVGDHVRQGDVLLVRRSRLGAGAKVQAREHGAVVLAHGEVTGHMHQLRGAQVTRYADERGHRYVTVSGAPEPLVHDEHTALLIPPGTFEQAVQVEYAPGPLQVVGD